MVNGVKKRGRGEKNRAKEIHHSLGNLADPIQFTDPIAIEVFDRDKCAGFLRSMVRIRVVEELIGQLVESGKAKCPCHLAIGQEAVAIGVGAHLTHHDVVYGGHRSHAHFIAVGGTIESLICEVLGKVSGCSKGMGGSMHLWNAGVGFFGSVPIVGATIPIAVGSALALKRDGGSNVAVCFFGDGASEEGIFHESLNLAATLKVPVVFVCENNLYSSHLDINLRQPSDLVSRFARANHIECQLVDGNDVCSVLHAFDSLLKIVRNERTPAFLEAVTYRWRGHVGHREDIDVGVRRSQADLDRWKQRDPIRRLADGMLSEGLLMHGDLEKIFAEERASASMALRFAENAPYPSVDQLLGTVYSGVPVQ